MVTARLIGKLTTSGSLSAIVSADQAIKGGLSIAGSIPAYAGALLITPGAEEQTIECSGLLMPENIIVNPIPQNYGLITWNGTTLTVS